MAQHAILRFEKHKGNPARPLEAHHERQKEQYASNPDIDTSRSKYNFHIVKPEGRYYHFIQNRIEQAGCRTRKDSTRFVDTLITASPEFFKKKSPKEIQEFFQRAADFLIGRVGKENIVSAVVHMDEKNAPPAFGLCPSDRGQPLVCKGDYREQSQPHKMAGRFSRLYGGEISQLGAWGKCQQDRQEAYPHPFVQTGGFPLPAEKMVSADGELLRAAQKIQGHDKRPFSRK